MPETDGEGTPARDAHIFEAYKRAAEQRERVELAPFVPDHAIDERVAEAEYHAAVIEYFSRLEPHLPDRRHYWKEVELYPSPFQADRERVVQALADCYNLTETDAVAVLEDIETDPSLPEIDPDADEIARGLRSLQRWRGRTTRGERTREDPIEGEIRETVERPVYMPKSLSLRAHAVLNQAAASLGFGPESETIEEWADDPV